MCTEDAGVGLDEPFDCLPDARLVSRHHRRPVRRAELSAAQPGERRLGGSPRCRHDACVNDMGLVSIVRDGVPGYEMWAGGSLGKAPSLAVLLSPFVPRDRRAAAVEALVEVFVAARRFDEPGQGSHEVRRRARWAPTRSAPPGSEAFDRRPARASRRSRRSTLLDDGRPARHPRRAPPGRLERGRAAAAHRRAWRR